MMALPGESKSGTFDLEGYKKMASHESLRGAKNYQRFMETKHPGVYHFKITKGIKTMKMNLPHPSKYTRDTWIKFKRN